ncbi:ABC transporter permease [Streptomyces pseudovenezuelae]|uniref:ABC-type transport system involved in multi-copper enzyme maturation permease subunit n=1 Tax=Streptomyces pseudovenezuelae TaxID=67350 RepID=A0ABT6LN54_9ACTN|nr:ABC transporter permease subunit [Streptomyces pseudovenezuelae]MDH6217678.1 ABC-type transport system involved in multi-copper enzyme maturation permease subunit [Streptomyces pseudovenezuelae]
MSTFTRGSTSTSTGSMSDGKNGTMNGTTDGTLNATTTEANRRPRLSGMTWLVWRQHRAAFWTILAAIALSVAWIVYQRGQLVDFLDGYGYPGKSLDEAGGKFQQYKDAFSFVSTGLQAIPILLGVFLGAPLIAGDLENGTAKLVAAQSMSRTRWLATKLALAGLVVVVSTGVLSAVFGWWWNPVKSEITVMDWTSGAAFNTTGPVPVALTLFSVFGGVAIGAVLRRTLPAMVVTFGFTVVLQLVWGYLLMSLGNVITVTTNKGVMGESAFPPIPKSAYQIDESYLTSGGDLLGWSTCSGSKTDAARQVCLDKADVVGWSVDYLPMSQMNGMQWFGASILFALTAGVVAFLFFWGRKRLV